jgi:hypothetical protein
MRITPKIEFHKGEDYAVLMLPRQTSDAPLAALYGDDRTVTKYGNLFSGAEDLLNSAIELRAAFLEGCGDAAPGSKKRKRLTDAGSSDGSGHRQDPRQSRNAGHLTQQPRQS